MSAGTKLRWAEARGLAEVVYTRISPLVVRMMAVGSLRRKCLYVGDVEFIAEPRLVVADLFGAKVPDTEPVKAALRELGTWVQGADRAMRITDVLGRPGMKVELYLVHPPANWFAQLAIRTGPWEFGREAMTRLQERGYAHRDGHVVNGKTGEAIDTTSEEQWFGLAGLPCLPPQDRDDFAHQVEQGRARANAAKARR